MKKLVTTICLMLAPLFVSGAAYDDDPTNYFVSGSGANEALEMVNEIICFFKNTRSEEFVNDGVYKATVYADECETVSSASSSADGAKPKSSSASSGDKQAATAEQKTGSTAILNVTRGDGENDPVLTKGWFALILKEEQGDQTMEMFIDVYIDMVQTAGVSLDNPKGEWSMRYALSAGKDMKFCPECETIPKGSPFGIGYIDSQGKVLRFKDNGAQGNANVIANFETNGDIEGIYMEENYIGSWEAGTEETVFVQNGFVVDAANKVFCKKLIKAEKIDFSNPDPETFAPTRTEYTPVEGDGLATGETCYSTDVTKAYRNVWRYGVYDSAGARYELSNQAFPLRATLNEGAANEQEIFAYAGYWGVHVDPESIGSVSDSVQFEKEDFSASEGSAPPKYTLKEKYTRVEKREKQYIALNDLHGLSLGMNLAGDTYWRKELQNLNAALADSSTYQEYEGKFDKDTQTFTLTEGVKFFPNYSKETLTTPIIFTTTQWLATMKKTWDAGTEWEFTDYAHLHVYSHDTQQGYSITQQAMNNPSDSTAPEGATDEAKRNDTSSGVSSEVTSVVKDFTEIAAAGGLKCLTECPTSAKTPQTFGDAFQKAVAAASSGSGRIEYQPDGNGNPTGSPSPYAEAGPEVTASEAAGSPYTIKWCPDCSEEQISFQAGEWVDGMLANEITTYSITNDAIYENGSPLTTGITTSLKEQMSAGTIRDPYSFFQGAQFINARGDVRDMSWGLYSGPMVLANQVSELECSKNNAGEYDGITPPWWSDSEKAQTRYCVDKMWSNKTLTTYNISMEMAPAFEIYNEAGSKVTFDPPKMLYFKVPDTEDYGSDRGKDLRLQYGGFGDLHGIPGYVIDINTGESKGQYFDGEWKDNYRYLSRFIIPPGSLVTDKVTGTTYKVKPLNGEEFLSLAPDAKGTLTYTATPADLVSDDLMIDVGPNGGDNFIGTKPTDAEITVNGGKPAVIHGKVIADPSPSSGS